MRALYILTALVILTLPGSAIARTFSPWVLIWDAPTLREDGTPIANTEIVGYDIEAGTQIVELGNVTQMSITSYPLGTTFRARTCDSKGCGAWSNSVKKLGAFPGAVILQIK